MNMRMLWSDFTAHKLVCSRRTLSYYENTYVCWDLWFVQRDLIGFVLVFILYGPALSLLFCSPQLPSLSSPAATIIAPLFY